MNTQRVSHRQTWIALLLTLACGWAWELPAVTNYVTNPNDSGPGSFRQAILDCNAVGGGLIVLSNSYGAITNQSNLPPLQGDIEITGENTGQVELSGGNRYRVLTIASGSRCVLRRLKITGGLATNAPGGGGILSTGALALVACIVEGNEAISVIYLGDRMAYGQEVSGGGILTLGSLTLLSSTVQSNSVRGGLGWPSSGTGGVGRGGGTCSRGQPIISNSLVIRNRADGGSGVPAPVGWPGGHGGSGFGGGVFVEQGDLRLIATTVAFNRVSGGFGSGEWGSGGSCYGGGIVSSSAAFINSTISGNAAYRGEGVAGNGQSLGGNLYCGSGSFALSYCTIADGSAAIGSEIAGTTVYLQNTIVAGSVAGATNEISGTIVSMGFNLIKSLAVPSASTDIVGVAPLLAPLQNYGSGVLIHALLPGSPAIDAGTNVGVAFDQRGHPRLADSRHVPNAPGSDGTDIGAVEADQSMSYQFVTRSGNNIRVTFSSDAGASYGVQYRTNFSSGSWVDLPISLVGTGGMLSFTDSALSDSSSKFYRLYER